MQPVETKVELTFMRSAFWVDAHGHLAFYKNDDLVRAHLRQARDLRFQYLVQGGYGPEDWQRQGRWQREIFTDQEMPRVVGCWGLHPWWLMENSEAETEQALHELANAPNSVMLGEIGLDYVRGRSTQARDMQKVFFAHQLRIAQAQRRAIVLHVVRAHAEALQVLKENAESWVGWVHGFHGPLEVASAYRQLGLLVSIGPQILGPRSAQLREVVARLELDDIVIESDWPRRPDCAEVQLDGVLQVAQAIAEIKAIPLASVQARTASNALGVIEWMRL